VAGRRLQARDDFDSASSPRSFRVHRSARMGKLAADALKRRQIGVKREKHGSTFAFTTASGRHSSRPNLTRRYFTPICEAASKALAKAKQSPIDGLTIHGLRHSMTSLAFRRSLCDVHQRTSRTQHDAHDARPLSAPRRQHAETQRTP
jgi:integrase